MNRRALLAAAPALWLAGCGREEAAEPPLPESETQRRGDLELLQQLLEVKRPALAAYDTPFAPDGFRVIEARHVARLEAEAADRGGAHRRRAPSPERDGEDREMALQRLVEWEETSVAVLLDALPKLGDPSLRTLAAEILPVEAQQLSVLQAELGRTRLPDPFIYGTRAR